MMRRKSIAGILACLLAAATLALASCSRDTSTETDTGAGTGTETETVAVTQPATDTGSDGSETTAPDTQAPESETEPEVKASYRLTLAESVGASWDCAYRSGQSVKEGETVKVALTLSPYYEGTLTVYAGETVLEPDGEGNYSFTMTEDTTLRVEGVTLKAFDMEGTGDSTDDPFLVTSVLDLLHIAEEINAGNATYVNGFYRLENDIDCGGETLTVIGDGRNDSAVFAGYFDGNGHTISNYNIKTNGTQYVGLFGVLQVNPAASANGINDLHIKDFSISASADGSAIFCGGLVGYGMGSTLVLCSAEGGVMDVYADSNAFAYVGGLMGIQQALDYDSYAYYAGTSYCYSDVTINCNSGSVYAAGGIIGYLTASTQLVPAYINNSYATGSVSGAMRSGGIVGYMAAGTSVVNCYATGTVAAQTFASDYTNYQDFCYAYAGGIAGGAETNCVVSESFSTSKLYAIAALGAAYGQTDGVLAHKYPVDDYDYSSHEATVYNCRYAEGGTDGDITLTKGQYLQDQLCWTTVDWIFKDGSYPTINLESQAYEFSLDFFFGDDSEGQPAEGFSQYMPLAFWYANGLPSQMVTGDEGDPRVSYGYYFDAECTMPVPDSFIPTHHMAIYAAVADVTPIAGDYVLGMGVDGAPLLLTLNTDGTFTYADAGQTTKGSYCYDGTRIILENARLGRYCTSYTGIGKYQLYTFAATLKDGRMEICGGVYESDSGSVVFFPTTQPLVALSCDRTLVGVYADEQSGRVYRFREGGVGVCLDGTTVYDLTYTRDGNSLSVTMDGQTLKGTIGADSLTLGDKTLRTFDAYAGSWSVASGANKVYSFDGTGGWTYMYYGYRGVGSTGDRTVYEYKSGSYTLAEDGSLTLSGDLTGTAAFVEGVLEVTIAESGTVSCYRAGSYAGTWVYEDYGLTLYLNGITTAGQGSARVEFVHENGTLEAYDLLYALDELDGETICLYLDGEVFGYLSYQPARNVLRAMMYVGTQNSFMDNVGLQRQDEYAGEWIGERDDLPLLSFDGKGAHTGYVTAAGETVPYTLDEATLSGSFVLGEHVYQLSFDEATGYMTLRRQDGETTVYRRKDAYGSLTLVDENGTLYSFDGRGELTDGGHMLATPTVGTPTGGTPTEYGYRVTDGEIVLYAGDRAVGSVTIDEDARAYRLTTDESSLLYIQSYYTGTWAMSGSLTDMTVGVMDLDGKMPGVINDQNVTFTLESDGSLSFAFVSDGVSTPFYAIPVGDTDLVLSSHKDWYLYDDQIVCARPDELIGTWENAMGAVYRFDGTSGSGLNSGSAQTGMMFGDEISSATYYSYTFADGYYVLWTVSSTTGETEIVRLLFCDPSALRAFVSADGERAFTVEQGDRLYRMDVIDTDSGITYSFDGFGTVTTSDGSTYSYKVLNIDYTNGIVSLTITMDGTTVHATIDFSTATNTISFE